MANIKIMRFFYNQYAVNIQKLTNLGYKILKNPYRRISVATSADHGTGAIKGTTKKVGVNYSPVPVCAFRRDNRQLLWETKSKPDGSYSFRNIAKGLECFIVAFDPNEEYNAMISDKVVAK